MSRKIILSYSFGLSLLTPLLCAVLAVEIMPNYNCKKSTLVCLKLKI